MLTYPPADWPDQHNCRPKSRWIPSMRRRRRSLHRRCSSTQRWWRRTSQMTAEEILSCPPWPTQFYWCRCRDGWMLRLLHFCWNCPTPARLVCRLPWCWNCLPPGWLEPLAAPRQSASPLPHGPSRVNCHRSRRPIRKATSLTPHIYSRPRPSCETRCLVPSIRQMRIPPWLWFSKQPVPPPRVSAHSWLPDFSAVAERQSNSAPPPLIHSRRHTACQPY